MAELALKLVLLSPRPVAGSGSSTSSLVWFLLSTSDVLPKDPLLGVPPMQTEVVPDLLSS